MSVCVQYVCWVSVAVYVCVSFIPSSCLSPWDRQRWSSPFLGSPPPGPRAERRPLLQFSSPWRWRTWQRVMVRIWSSEYEAVTCLCIKFFSFQFVFLYSSCFSQVWIRSSWKLSGNLKISAKECFRTSVLSEARNYHFFFTCKFCKTFGFLVCQNVGVRHVHNCRTRKSYKQNSLFFSISLLILVQTLFLWAKMGPRQNIMNLRSAFFVSNVDV